MKLIKQFIPYIFLIVLAFAQIINTSSVTRLASRRMKSLTKSGFFTKQGNDSAAGLEPSNTMAVWDAFKKAGFMDYIDIIIGFIGAWDGNISGVWVAVRKSAGFVPFMNKVQGCVTPDMLQGTTPPNEEMRKVSEQAITSFQTVEKNTDAQNCALSPAACTPAEKPAKTGMAGFAAKVIGVYAGIRNFKSCFMTLIEKNEKMLAKAWKELKTHLWNWLSLTVVTQILKGIFKLFTLGGSTIALFTVNIVRFGVILYRVVKKWKSTGKIAFPMVGTLMGLCVKTILDLAVKRKLKLRKYK